jgi:hypothetical protein
MPFIDVIIKARECGLSDEADFLLYVSDKYFCSGSLYEDIEVLKPFLTSEDRCYLTALLISLYLEEVTDEV